MFHHCDVIIAKLCYQKLLKSNKRLCYAEIFEIQPCEREYLCSVYKCIFYNTNVYCIYRCILCNIMLQNEEVCGNTIYSSSEASGVNHIIYRSRRLR